MNHSGTLHMFVAFDWGDEIDLEQVRGIAPAESLALARRPRTPMSFSYHPAPLQLTIEPVRIQLGPLGTVAAATRITLFDFASVSVSLRLPFTLAHEELPKLAGVLADPAENVQSVRQAIVPLFQQLLPAIRGASFNVDLVEEYFVFEFPHDAPDLSQSRWIANLVHLENVELSEQEAEEALRLHLSYSPTDLLVADWAAAVLFDRDCEETLQAIEFANSQLLQNRSLDQRLDASFAEADKLIRRLTRGRLPFWRLFNRPLRTLGELKVDASALFERTGNALKLIGDPYLARVYRMLSTRFHLETWEKSIVGKVGVVEDVYQVLADQAAAYRGEFLEILVVLLILIEIVLALFHH